MSFFRFKRDSLCQPRKRNVSDTFVYWQYVHKCWVITVTSTVRKNCPNMELFLVRIFLYSVRKQKNTDQKSLRIWTLFTQCTVYLNSRYWGIEILRFLLPRCFFFMLLLFSFLIRFVFKVALPSSNWNTEFEITILQSVTLPLSNLFTWGSLCSITCFVDRGIFRTLSNI